MEVPESELVGALITSLLGLSTDVISRTMTIEELRDRMSSLDSGLSTDLSTLSLFHLTHIAYTLKVKQISSYCLLNILQWFLRLATDIQYCRVFCQSSLDDFPGETSNNKGINSTFNNNSAATSIKISLYEVLMSTEQELGLLEARLAGKQSGDHRTSTLPLEEIPITLMQLFRHCKTIQPMYASMVALIKSYMKVLSSESKANKEAPQRTPLKSTTKPNNKNDNKAISHHNFPSYLGFWNEFEVFVRKTTQVELSVSSDVVIRELLGKDLRKEMKEVVQQKGPSMRLYLPSYTISFFGHWIKLLLTRYTEFHLTQLVKQVWSQDTHRPAETGNSSLKHSFSSNYSAVKSPPGSLQAISCMTK